MPFPSKPAPKPYPYVYSYSSPHRHGSSPPYTSSYLPTHSTPSPPLPPSPTSSHTSSFLSLPDQDATSLVPLLLHLHTKGLALGRLHTHLRSTRTYLPLAPPSLRYEVRQAEFELSSLRAECIETLGGTVPSEPETKELLLRTLYLLSALDVDGEADEAYEAIWERTMQGWYLDLERRERELETRVDEWRALGRQVDWVKEKGGRIGRRAVVKELERKRGVMGREVKVALEEWEGEVLGMYERVRVECQ